MELEVRHLIRIDRRDTPANPSHDRDRHRVADRLVARAVRTILGGLSLPGDLRMPIGETLQAFALERGESADEHGVYPRGLVSGFRCDHRAIPAALEGGADISAYSRMRVEVTHGNRIAPVAGCDHVRVIREQRKRGVAVSAQLLVAGGNLLVDGIGAAGANEGRLLHAGSGGESSAEGSIADDTHLVAGILREPEGLVGGILGYRSAHHHGGIVLAHVGGQASGNLVADMAMRLRACHADDVLAPVCTGGRIAPGRQAPCDLCAVLGRCHALSVGAIGAADHIPLQRQDGRRMPVRGERVRLLHRIPYRVCSGRGAVLEACARSAASSSAGKLLPLFTARLRIP